MRMMPIAVYQKVVGAPLWRLCWFKSQPGSCKHFEGIMIVPTLHHEPKHVYSTAHQMLALPNLPQSPIAAPSFRLTWLKQAELTFHAACQCVQCQGLLSLQAAIAACHHCQSALLL